MFRSIKNNIENECQDFEKKVSQYYNDYYNYLMPSTGNANDNEVIEPNKRLKKINELRSTLDALYKKQDTIILMIINQIKQSENQDEKTSLLEQGRYLIKLLKYPIAVVNIECIKIETELLTREPKLTQEEIHKEFMATAPCYTVFEFKDDRLEELAKSIEKDDNVPAEENASLKQLR